jgi:hypothetical protein
MTLRVITAPWGKAMATRRVFVPLLETRRRRASTTSSKRSTWPSTSQPPPNGSVARRSSTNRPDASRPSSTSFRLEGLTSSPIKGAVLARKPHRRNPMRPRSLFTVSMPLQIAVFEGPPVRGSPYPTASEGHCRNVEICANHGSGLTTCASCEWPAPWVRRNALPERANPAMWPTPARRTWTIPGRQPRGSIAAGASPARLSPRRRNTSPPQDAPANAGQG